MTMSPNPRDNSVATKFILKLQWVILQLNLESEFWKEKKNRPGDCHHLECPGRWGLPAALRAGPAATMCTYQLGSNWLVLSDIKYFAKQIVPINDVWLVVSFYCRKINTVNTTGCHKKTGILV